MYTGAPPYFSVYTAAGPRYSPAISGPVGPAHNNRICGRLKAREGNVMMRSALLAALVSAALPTMALAQSADDLKNDEKSPATSSSTGWAIPGSGTAR